MAYNDPAKRKAASKRYSATHPKTTEYMAWRHMRARVRPQSRHHVNYFDRGITCCQRWSSSKNFLADMGKKPSPELTLERRDNDKGYYPDNCYWGTRTVQNENQRPRKDNSSGCTGVYLDNTGGYSVELQGKYIGYTSTLEDAVDIRKKAEIALYGRLRRTSQFNMTQNQTKAA